MGVTIRSAPWWLTWVVAGALLLLLIGERVLGEAAAVRMMASGVGLITLLAVTGWRIVSWRNAPEHVRAVEQILVLCYVGCVIAVLGFLLSSEAVMSSLGIEFRDRVVERRYEVTAQVLSSIVLAVSLLPALAAQWSLASHRHAGATAASVESLRVREVATGAATVALAGALMFVMGYITTERNKSLDLSYFKTSSPGTATQEVVKSFGDPLRVLLFFPAVNPVRDEVVDYFHELDRATNVVQVEEYDRLIAADTARQYQVSADGTIVLRRGENTERLTLSPTLNTARSRLRTLDRDVQDRLLRLARERRTAYLTVGHGELGDRLPADTVGPGDPLRQITGVRELLGVLNYQVEELGLSEGLGRDVPENAAIVLVLGPRLPFLEEELASLDRYLERGGSVLLAIDPESEFRFGPLEQRLGVRYRFVPLADERQFVTRNRNESDRQLIITDRFSVHEAVTTASRTRIGSGILLVGAGYLEALEGHGLRHSFIVRSLPTNFGDENRNFTLDGDESRRVYNLVAAIEPAAPDTLADDLDVEASAADTAGMRALVYADAGMFSDAVLASIALNTALVADGIRWLGREEAFSGVTESEEDIALVHTKAEDVRWFYSTILGAPLIVLGGGLVAVYWRRKKRQAGGAA